MQGRLSVQEVKECAAACLASPKTSITTRSVIQEGFDIHEKMQRKRKRKAHKYYFILTGVLWIYYLEFGMGISVATFQSASI